MHALNTENLVIHLQNSVMYLRRYIAMISMFILIVTSTTVSMAQNFSLQQLIRNAQSESLARLEAENRKKNRSWAYQAFKASYKPRLVLRGTLPAFNRSIEPVIQPDGSQVFRERSLSSSRLNLNLEQNIGLTGGTIFLGSQLERIDLFNEQSPNITTYASTPLRIGIFQPLFSYNAYKWDNLVQPLIYEESQKAYVEELETIASDINSLFFNALMAQIDFELANTNIKSIDTLYLIGLERYKIATISKSDLLRLELSKVQAGQLQADARVTLQEAQLKLNSYLGSKMLSDSAKYIIPKSIPNLEINPAIALDQAKNNREQWVKLRRQKIEADQQVAKAKGESGLQVDINGSFGQSSTAQNLSMLFPLQQQQQVLEIGLAVPILDWGRQRAIRKSAEANKQLTMVSVSRNELQFEQEIITMCQKIPILKSRVLNAEIASSIAKETFEMALTRYGSGNMTLTDLGIVQENKDKTKRDYVTALRDFWTSYYQLRLLTLYDFQNNEQIRYTSKNGL